MSISKHVGHARLEVATLSRGALVYDATDPATDCVNWNADREGHLNIFETLDFADDQKRQNIKIATIPAGQWLDVRGLDEQADREVA